MIFLRRPLAALAPRMTPWVKWAGDLSGTRTQVVIAVVGMWLLVAWKTYTLISTPDQGVMLLGAMNTAVMAALSAWLAAKVNETVREIKTNGTKKNGGSDASHP